MPRTIVTPLRLDRATPLPSPPGRQFSPPNPARNQIYSLGGFVAFGGALSSRSSCGGSLKGYVVLVEENKLPSSDMGVRAPLLRVRARASSCSSTLRIGCSSCLKTLRICCSSRGYLDFPLLPGDPTKCMHFAGSPIRAFLPRDVTARARLRGGVNFAAYQSHGRSFPPSEYTFGGDPLESAVLLKCGTNFSPP